jgi:hypothetical protein
MGLATLPSAIDGTPIPASHHNAIVAAMQVNMVPRNASSVATNNAGTLGESSLAWLRAYITTGYFFPGMIMPVHTYNGAVSPGHGWMKCDGRIINETNYNTEHGAGSWASYIGSTALDGKYLPNLAAKYLTFAATTTQTGASPLTFIGNANNQINIQHSHTVASHSHRWADYLGTTPAKTWNSEGSAITLDHWDNPTYNDFASTALLTPPGQDYYTEAGSPATNNGLTTTQTIAPESLETIAYMRII